MRSGMNWFEAGRRLTVVSAGIFVLLGVMLLISQFPWGVFDAILFTIGGVVSIYIASFVIGWVIRGLMGIPSGYDQRPKG